MLGNAVCGEYLGGGTLLHDYLSRLLGKASDYVPLATMHSLQELGSGEAVVLRQLLDGSEAA